MFYKLKIDVVGNDYLTTTYDSVERYRSVEAAEAGARVTREMLLNLRDDYRIKDYRVGIVPSNEDNCAR